MLTATKSEILDPKNRNKARPNLPPAEMKALAQLIDLQRKHVITIKPCDKGAGIIILNFTEYIRACEKHLNCEQIQSDGSRKPYYRKVKDDVLDEVRTKINDVVEEAFDNEILTKPEYEAMRADEKAAARFYATFKVHKTHEVGKAPPERPIISGNGSVTENISAFVDHHIKALAVKHFSFLQDTPDFLRYLESEINSGEKLPANTIVATIDVVGLYTNIPIEDGLEAVRDALEEREDKSVSTEFLVRLLEIVLKNNIFEFNQQLFQQLIGTAMGTKCAPNYSNLFMAKKIDPEIIKMAIKHGEGTFPIRLFKRFLDDIIMLWCGSVEGLHSFIKEINTINSSIQFTLVHTTIPSDEQPNCPCEKVTSLPFLDTSLSILDGRVIIDLYKKPTDRNQYLLTSSCHPAHVTNNIPYSLALRIVRICSNMETRDLRLEELKGLLLSRGYKAGVINEAVEKARKIPREDALKRVENNSTQRPVFVVQYDPRLPSITSITRRHWRSMITRDPKLQEIFPDPPLVAYKVAPNLRSKLIRAKIPPEPSTRPRRIRPGMKKCGKPRCPACPYIQTGPTFKATATAYKVDLNSEVDCTTTNLCYAISCGVPRCGQQYIGQTSKSLKERFAQHLGYVDRNVEATGRHFNLPGHSKSDMLVQVVEKIHNKHVWAREEIESIHIRKANTYHKGINNKP